MKQELSLSSVAEIDDGRIAVAFNQALRRVFDDLRDRPAVRSARKVSLVVEHKPTIGETGQLDEVQVTFKIDDNLPKRESRSYSMVPDRKGTGILFNNESLEDGRQGTLDDVKGPRAVVDRQTAAAGGER